MPQENNSDIKQVNDVIKKKHFIGKRFLKVALVLFAAALVVGGGYFFIQKQGYSGGRSREYSQAWRLVPEKVSKSAAIRIYAPAGMTASQVSGAVIFEPEIKGHWIKDTVGFLDIVGVAYGQDTQTQSEYAQFKPDQPLAEGLYYGVRLALADGNYLAADFLAAEDPKIDAIFPKGDMEAPEDSKITIVFNRPMVALSTADAMEPKDLPVTITPETEGKWKWISTNTLQFIPDKTLRVSSNYRVKVGAGLKSFDGLDVAQMEASFKTRNLRYLDMEESQTIVYNQPYRIYFNQPVDLDKTASSIKVFDNTQNKDIDFVAEYKKADKADKVSRTANNRGLAGKFEQVKGYLADLKASLLEMLGKDGSDYDKSVIEIYAKKDKYSRNKFWNTSSNYTITIDKAYPAEGDIIIGDQKKIGFSSSGLIGGLAQIGGRSDYNDKNMFDPQGKLSISFYEPVDIGPSSFGATLPITKKEYGKKCDDPNFGVDDLNCNEVDDTKTVLLSFDASKAAPGQEISLKMDKIVNFSGTKINGEALGEKIIVYPELKYHLATKNDRIGLNSLVICSNNPLRAPERKDLRNYIKADRELEVFSWGESWRRTYRADASEIACNEGEFETNISVGLIPNINYQFDLRADDLFGQTIKESILAATGAMENNYVSLFPMQQEISVTTADRTKLTYGSKNITYADVVICKLSPYNFYRWRQNIRYDSYPVPSSCIEKQTRKIEIGQRYWLNNYFDIDIAQGFSNSLGNYVVVLSHPQYTRYDGGQNYVTSYVTVTGLSAAQKSINLDTYLSSSETDLSDNQLAGLKNIYWVTNIKTLAPISGAQVSLYLGSNVVGTTVTDSQGIATLKPVAGADLAVVEYGGDATVIAGYDTKMNWVDQANNVRRAYIYSDRPIYRPGDRVNIKGILRLGYDGNYQMWDKKQAKIIIRDPRWDTAATLDANIDEFGAFTAEYTLDGAAALGNYEVCAEGSYDCGNFSVKEYVPAAFSVTAATEKEEYVSKDKIKINVNASYYFGVPVANAKVEYTISSQNYYFDKYREGGYNFGFYEDCENNYCYGDKFIGRGELALDKDGKGTINQIIDLQKIGDQGDYANSRIVVFDITATNSMGQSISTQKSVVIHAGSIYLGAKVDPSFAAKGQSISISAIAVNTEGKVTDAHKVKATVYKVDWVYAKRLEAGGNYNYDWTRKRDQIASLDLDSKGNGKFEGKTSFSETGEYEIDISGSDDNNNQVMSREYVYIYGDGTAGIRLYDDSSLTLKAENKNLEAGQKGSLIIESPFNKAKALVAIERGQVFKYEVVDIDGSLYNYTFDVENDYQPNVFVSVLLQSTDPAVKFGSQEFTVNGGDHKINIDVSSDKKIYKPGEKVALNLHVSDNNNKPVAAQISVAVVDLSVLALAGNPKKDPLVFFYNGFPLTVNTYSSMKEVLVKVDKDSLTKGGSGGGNDNGDNDVRGEFRDTAFWRGNVVTDAGGNARIEFDLPDNLTTWQAEAVGVTKDTRLGAGYAEFMSRNDLMVVPVKPRFIVPGDEFYVAAQIFNQSDKEQDTTIGFSSDTLQFIGKDKKLDSRIGSKESKTVYFKVRAPLDQTKGVHSFTISANGKGVNDAIRQTIPVRANLTYEATATANYITGAGAAEVIYLPTNVSSEQGTITVKSSATLAVFLSDALNYFVGYPYGCTEQISSRLKAMAAVKAGLNVPNLADKFQLDTVWIDNKEYTINDLIDIGLAKVYRNQNSDGGFGLWESSRVDYYTTLKAVEMLKDLRKAGVAINQDSLERALGYIDREFTENVSKMNDDQIVATAAILIDGSSQYQERAKTAIRDLIGDKSRRASLLNDKLSNRSLAQLAIMLFSDDFAGAVKDINATLDNRITIDSRGAFLQAKISQTQEETFETTIGDTALYLRSLAANKRDTEFTDKVVRWILNSRDKDGAWGSTQNTLGVVEAFTDYLNWKKETEAEFTLETLLNSQQISKKEFNAKSILDQSVVKMGIDKFKIGQNNIIGFNKTGIGKSGFYYDVELKYYLSGLVLARDEGFSVSRNFYALDDEEGAKPLASAKPGDVVREHLEINIGRDRRAVAIEDFIPAGMEIVDMELATEQKSLRFTDPQVRYNQLNPDYTELRDDRAFIYNSYLAAGTYEFDYYVRALAKGEYLQLPCVASEFYNPENFGRTASNYFEIK